MGKKETIVTTDSVQTIPHEYLGCSASSSSCGDDHLQADFEEDELHLIGAEWQKPNDSFLNVKNIQFLILNLILNLLAITWLIHKNYSIDLIGIILITLSGWLWVFCAIIVGKWIIKLREKSMLNGKADDFRNYVRHVANLTTTTLPPAIIKSNNFYFSNTSTNRAEFI